MCCLLVWQQLGRMAPQDNFTSQYSSTQCLHKAGIKLSNHIFSKKLVDHELCFCDTSACSVAVSYKPPMLVTRVRLPACAFFQILFPIASPWTYWTSAAFIATTLCVHKTPQPLLLQYGGSWRNAFPETHKEAVPQNDPGRTRTCNPRLRRPMPYPLGHGASCV